MNKKNSKILIIMCIIVLIVLLTGCCPGVQPEETLSAEECDGELLKDISDKDLCLVEDCQVRHLINSYENLIRYRGACGKCISFDLTEIQTRKLMEVFFYMDRAAEYVVDGDPSNNHKAEEDIDDAYSALMYLSQSIEGGGESPGLLAQITCHFDSLHVLFINKNELLTEGSSFIKNYRKSKEAEQAAKDKFQELKNDPRIDYIDNKWQVVGDLSDLDVQEIVILLWELEENTALAEVYTHAAYSLLSGDSDIFDPNDNIKTSEYKEAIMAYWRAVEELQYAHRKHWLISEYGFDYSQGNLLVNDALEKTLIGASISYHETKARLTPDSFWALASGKDIKPMFEGGPLMDIVSFLQLGINSANPIFMYADISTTPQQWLEYYYTAKTNAALKLKEITNRYPELTLTGVVQELEKETDNKLLGRVEFLKTQIRDNQPITLMRNDYVEIHNDKTYVKYSLIGDEKLREDEVSGLYTGQITLNGGIVDLYYVNGLEPIRNIIIREWGGIIVYNREPPNTVEKTEEFNSPGRTPLVVYGSKHGNADGGVVVLYGEKVFNSNGYESGLLKGEFTDYMEAEFDENLNPSIGFSYLVYLKKNPLFNLYLNVEDPKDPSQASQEMFKAALLLRETDEYTLSSSLLSGLMADGKAGLTYNGDISTFKRYKEGQTVEQVLEAMNGKFFWQSDEFQRYEIPKIIASLFNPIYTKLLPSLGSYLISKAAQSGNAVVLLIHDIVTLPSRVLGPRLMGNAVGRFLLKTSGGRLVVEVVSTVAQEALEEVGEEILSSVHPLLGSFATIVNSMGGGISGFDIEVNVDTNVEAMQYQLRHANLRVFETPDGSIVNVFEVSDITSFSKLRERSEVDFISERNEYRIRDVVLAQEGSDLSFYGAEVELEAGIVRGGEYTAKSIGIDGLNEFNNIEGGIVTKRTYVGGEVKIDLKGDDIEFETKSVMYNRREYVVLIIRDSTMDIYQEHILLYDINNNGNEYVGFYSMWDEGTCDQWLHTGSTTRIYKSYIEINEDYRGEHLDLSNVLLEQLTDELRRIKGAHDIVFTKNGLQTMWHQYHEKGYYYVHYETRIVGEFEEVYDFITYEEFRNIVLDPELLESIPDPRIEMFKDYSTE
ncbi:hypothetical protein JXB41_04200 [Candidatus Woesearchaeota archaeon]|nr:hypothetical protein [Candidatus Woesearchaeota archaeon]